MTSTQIPSPLADVKVGDTLIVMPGVRRSYTATVTHVTPTRVTVGPSRYHKKDGSKVGDHYGPSVRVPRPGELEERKRELAAKALLRRILAIVAPPHGTERNHARLIAGPIENLEQALALLADTIRDEDEAQP